MRAMAFLPHLLFLCSHTWNKVQSRNFLMETENSTESFKKSNDYGNVILGGVGPHPIWPVHSGQTHHHHHHHHHPPPPPPPPPPPKKKPHLYICFSGSSAVKTFRGTLSVSDLKLGDYVLTQRPGQAAHFTEFLGWLDRSASKLAILLNVSTNSSSITLSASHVIFRATKSGSIESIYAGDLQKGDKLVKSKSDKLMEEEEVVNIETVMESSFWAPLTQEGTLLVDGFLASSYASYPHQASEMLMAPVKMFPKLLLDDENSQHKDGVRKVVIMLKAVANRMGLRRKEGEQENKVDRDFLLPNTNDAPIIAGTFSKNIEF